jgi:arylsulfatase A-like enzyme
MERRQFLIAVAGGVTAFAAAAPKPSWNFLFILVDDMGWHDIAPNGNTCIDTPNLTRFASESVRFTNAYAACPVCSPTRASIMTGKYPARLHLTDWIPGRKQWPYAKLLTPAFEQHLPLEETTIAEVLHPLKYKAASIGKWHLGGEGYLPTNQGFDSNIGGSAAGHPPRYFGPLNLPGLKLEPNESLTQRVTYEGSRFMRENKKDPFFLYESHFTVHMPLQARQEVIDKYRARNIGDVDPIYCAMVESADDSVGQLLKTLDESGEADRTIVVFFSDNGGVRYQARRAAPVTNNAPLRAGKGHVYEGGIREPLLIRWPGVTKGGKVVDDPVCSIDFFPTFCDAAGVPHGAVDGVSIRNILAGKHTPERPLFWHYPHYSDQGGVPSGAVRLGNWKLIEFFEDGRLELFNLENDLGERRNLVKREVGRAKHLHGLLRDWRKSVNASMPKPNLSYDPARASEGLTGYEPPTLPV